MGTGPLRRLAWVEACDADGCRRLGPVDPAGAEYTSPDLAGPATYAVGREQVGKRLRVVVAGYSWRGVSTASSELTPAVTGPPIEAAPTYRTTSPPYVEIVGNTLVAPRRFTHWSSIAQPELAFQWERCAGETCEPAPGAAGPLHPLVTDDVGHELRVTFTATNAYGSVSGTSARIGVSAEMLRLKSGALAVDQPRLSGVAQAGLPLQVEPGAWIDDGSAHRYSWQRCTDTCSDIPGAAAATYTPTSADVGARLRTLVTATGTVRTWSGRPATVNVATATTEPVLPGREDPGPQEARTTRPRTTAAGA
ncbi:hypothetical protein [Nocardioides sp. cx-173]|uniref:hypothetical protein n=1 Tax=Nocardioides sp. cx-173 TaxID=2898796 RepID=UPI001E304271|nr:hypothetical protein [Nocardioides sp. cx-173]MCD4525193.1 hypothetical protein [Nocardioides sp. cx-173]UGB40109.1 hypothetical protein LQ940_11935 [Nocardioides sp. cx-173]